jgi:hypothetical protein
MGGLWKKAGGEKTMLFYTVFCPLLSYILLNNNEDNNNNNDN